MHEPACTEHTPTIILVIPLRVKHIPVARSAGLDLHHGRLGRFNNGIPKENLTQIFEPFFTTKPVGSGSGLGLSMVQGFMKQSGGTVRVYSEEGIGTTFKLYFKATERAEDDVFPEHEPDVGLPGSRARILIVEEDKAVLDVLKTTLANKRYEIVCAQSGDEAQRIWNGDPNFDIVVTDIVMPGSLQGTHLAQYLRERRPDLPVVFMSGYAREATVHGNGLRPQDVRLMKPVQRADLLNAMQSTIDRSEGQ